MSVFPLIAPTPTSHNSSKTFFSTATIGLLSNVTASLVQIEGEGSRAPRNAAEAQRGEILTAAQTAAARNFVNRISGSTRMLCHGLLYVGKGNLAYIQEQTDQNEPDSWKGYNISNAAKVDNDPNSLMRQWRHDDEEVAYPTFELIQCHRPRSRQVDFTGPHFYRPVGAAGSEGVPIGRTGDGQDFSARRQGAAQSPRGCLPDFDLARFIPIAIA